MANRLGRACAGCSLDPRRRCPGLTNSPSRQRRGKSTEGAVWERSASKPSRFKATTSVFSAFDHLQLVYQDETDFIDSQDYWFVIEGIQDGSLFASTLGASGEGGRLSLGVANGGSRDELIGKIGTPETRGSRIISSGPNCAVAVG